MECELRRGFFSKLALILYTAWRTGGSFSVFSASITESMVCGSDGARNQLYVRLIMILPSSSSGDITNPRVRIRDHLSGLLLYRIVEVLLRSVMSHMVWISILASRCHSYPAPHPLSCELSLTFIFSPASRRNLGPFTAAYILERNIPCYRCCAC